MRMYKEHPKNSKEHKESYGTLRNYKEQKEPKDLEEPNPKELLGQMKP